LQEGWKKIPKAAFPEAKMPMYMWGSVAAPAGRIVQQGQAQTKAKYKLPKRIVRNRFCSSQVFLLSGF
jgi:hypothetical protein